MRIACAATVGTLLLLCVDAATLNRQKRQTDPNSATCGDDTTLVESKFIKTGNFTKCPITTIISRYWEPFLDECQHWMGSRPDHVASSNVDYCLPDATTGGVTIRAKICCKGIAPANRCLVYSGCSSNNPEECDYNAGAVSTCADDERCETRISCGSTATQGILVKACVKKNSCSSSTSCAAKNYLYQGESCATCCTGAFCNKGGRNLGCYSDTTCSCPDMEAGNYRCVNSACVCKDGCSGDRCQTCAATCTPNPCKNGGRCKKTSSGISCCCAPGFGGTYCDSALPQCDRNRCSNKGKCVINSNVQSCVCDDGYHGNSCEIKLPTLKCSNATNVYTPIKQIALSSTCSALVSTQLSKTSELGACLYHMRDNHNTGGKLFEDGKNGHVSEVTDIRYGSCNNDNCGDALYETQICCPSCFSSPCQNGGYCVQKNFSAADIPVEDYVCRCKFGFTGKYCQETVKTCFVYGEPHYLTFDGKGFAFQGACTYVLVKSENNNLVPFTILVKNEHRGTDTAVSYPGYIQIDMYGYSLRLGRNNVVQAKTPGSTTWQTVSLNIHHQLFSITKAGRFVKFSVPSIGLVVAYDGYNMMYVQVADKYKGLLSGLCNNMDDNRDNDLTDCKGVSQTDNAAGYTALGDSCLVPGQDQQSCKTDVPADCDTSPYTSNDWCGYIINSNGPFGSCANSEDAQTLYKSCLYDVCRNNDNKCPSLERFATTCKDTSPDWRTKTRCPMKCPANSHYEFSGSACQPTCEDRLASQSCDSSDTEVCVCDTGRILLDETCVPISQCGCRDSQYVRHKFGDVWDVNTVTCKQKTCLQCTAADCKNPGQIKEESSPSVNGGWDNWTSWSTCDPTNNQLSRSRACDNPSPQCGGQPCSGNSIETKPCPVITTPTPEPTTPTPTPTTTIPTPVCAPDFNFTKACDECKRTENPLMFFADPCSCGTYYQCEPQGSGYRVHLRPCSYCTCFNPNTLTCDHDHEKKHPETEKCVDIPIIRPDVITNGLDCTTWSVFYYRRFQAIKNDNTHYIDVDGGNNRMPCAGGTVFSLKQCDCVLGQNIVAEEAFMCLNFDGTYPFASKLWVKPRIGSIYKAGEIGVIKYAMQFSRLTIEVPGFKNKDIRRMTASVWINRRPSVGGEMAIISNDDCRGAANIAIISTSQNDIEAGVITTNDNLIRRLVHRNAVNNAGWIHVVMTFSFDKEVVLYINGFKVMSHPVNGYIAGNKCPLLIGSEDNGRYFNGLMDQICIYDRAFDAREVKYLFDQEAPTGTNNNIASV